MRLHSRVPIVHARVELSFVNGPVVFWDLSRVPKDYREGGHLPPRSDRKWEPVKFGYPLPCLPLSKGGAVLQAELPLL
ncbi:unnamed protein product, partial [Staurois parvus]